MKFANSLGPAAAALLIGCASGLPDAPAVGGPYDAAPPAVAPDIAAYDEVGIAGWYGEELAGNKTANGERFDPSGMTAAHRTLPLGSHVEVTALDTGRVVLLRINDRGPYHPKRIIDLSRGAAQRLGIAGVGAVRVRGAVPNDADRAALASGRAAGARLDAPESLLKALRKRLPGGRGAGASPKLPPPVVPLTVAPNSVRSGSHFVQVASFASEARARALAARVDGAVSKLGALWRVRLGPFKTVHEATAARAEIARKGFGDAAVVTAP